MFRVLPLLILLRLHTVRAGLPNPDGRLKRLTVSPDVDVATLMTANPLLRRLPMFANTPKPTRRFSPPPPPPPVDRKTFPNVGDNFDALYRQINETFFGMAIREKHQIPTGRALSDDNLPERTANEIEQQMMEEEPPFAVTESLLDAMQPTPKPEALEVPEFQEEVEPPPEERSWTETPPTTRTFSPAVDRVFVDEVPTSTEEPTTTSRAVEKTDSQIRTLLNKGLPGLAPLRRASDWQVQMNDKGRYLVSGTRFYQDNRIDGGITGLSEEYQPPGNRWELRHIQNDPRYVIEAELTKMRAHAAALKKTGRPLAFGAKIVDAKKIKDIVDEKNGKVIPIKQEKKWPSKVKMVEEDGKMFERRNLFEAGQMVEVSVSNRHLFGHDIYTYPGSVIHGPLLRNTRLRQNISKCFDSRPSTTLVGVVPFDRRIGNSPIQCLRVCAMSPLCRSVVYDEILSICDVFSEKPGVSSTIARPSQSSTLFEPSVDDPESCLRSSRAKLHAAPLSPQTHITVHPLSAATVQSVTTEELQIVDRDADSCKSGEEQLFARLEGVRVGGQRKEKAYVTNEDDCVFACLTDSEMEKRGPCGAVGYTHTTQECTLYNELADELEVHEATTLYHKICVTAATNLVCSGATIEHVRQAVLGKAMREAKSVESRAQCIAECLGASRNSGYVCLSIMFYPKEKTNCILNDASVVTAPESLVTERKREVDYYGVDECYGLEDVTHKKESNLLVEDDVRPGQITQGSKVEALN